MSVAQTWCPPEQPCIARPDEPYMSQRQLAHFRERLESWREELTELTRETLEQLRERKQDVGDEADSSSFLEMQDIEIRTRERYRKLVVKIDQALARIKDGNYGYCELTGEPIGLERLNARPIANLCLHAQEIKEMRERQTMHARVRMSVS